ncbi:16S rRNA (guanine(966)-N(2))-methyltransferase RsmD [Mariprofundus ferrinatatus]|uniref:16S rRNA (guanine(966)-N(2))-methyltransferase RsmD n=1 Tax=Mariprofundus ferrinatatus TaxID=1921087 RepID=UPI001E2AD020|nr:16S rRNA (guanine(966)-N(2))-methyltransferase RsmD [Mariprofundus ferrinatatus]
MRGRILKVPDITGLRPTPSKVRQAMFNILGPVEDMSVLDLFSGSGVMALEALSRGAANALSIEKNRSLTQRLSAIRMAWGLESQWQIKTASVEKGLAALAGNSFDLIFADPPYQQGFCENIPTWLDSFEIGCAQLIIEESSRMQPVWPTGWQCAQSRRYGDTTLHFLSRLP